MVLPDRIELSTSPLPRECSTTELRQHGQPRGPAEVATLGRLRRRSYPQPGGAASITGTFLQVFGPNPAPRGRTRYQKPSPGECSAANNASAASTLLRSCGCCLHCAVTQCPDPPGQVKPVESPGSAPVALTGKRPFGAIGQSVGIRWCGDWCLRSLLCAGTAPGLCCSNVHGGHDHQARDAKAQNGPHHILLSKYGSRYGGSPLAAQ